MFKKKNKKGNMSLVMLVLGIGVALIMYVLTGVISGQTYQVTQTQIDAITDASIKGNLTAGIGNGFVAYKQAGDYMPLVILGQVLAIVLATVFSAVAIVGALGGNRGGMTGGAL